MGYFKYDKAQNKFQSNALMIEILKRMKDFDEFHCLRDSNLLIGGEVTKLLVSAPEEYIKWMTICNGGYLFDTLLLSVDKEDSEIDFEFASLEEYNRTSERKTYLLPDGYSIIAMRSYGDPICISTEKGDNSIYLWDCEQGDFTEIWDTFYDFLADEVNTALELIANEDLEPFPFKVR